MQFDKLLQLMVKQNASDLFITAGVPPSMKVNGQILPVGNIPLNGQQTLALIEDIMTPAQQEEFTNTHECQFAISDAAKSARFRVSAFIQRDMAGMVLRKIESNIPSIEALCLPPVLRELALEKRGIILLVGGSGTGKSTTLAAIVGYRNQHSHGHIITIEDPIEFLHPHQGCIITQREVGVDTLSFEAGLKNSLRQTPDVILIGEIRNREVMSYAIQYAETGHLVLASLHANNANQAIDRIIHFFAADRHPQLLLELSLNLRAIIAQQLVPTLDGKRRRVAAEVLLNSKLVGEYIRQGEIQEIKSVMMRSTDMGMQTLDQALFGLYEAGEISFTEAIKHADSANDLRLKIRLESRHRNPENPKDNDEWSLDFND